MKAAILSLSLILASSFAQAAKITAAEYDAATDSVVLQLVYGGGCGKHEFSLDYGVCLESYPGQATAQLIHKTDDSCEAMLYSEEKISLKDFACRPGYLTIEGDAGSRATVLVPQAK